jgi:Tfp pilus assembly protein PilZ
LLLLPLRNRAAFRQQSFEQDQGGLFVPGDADIALGDEVELEIHFLAEEVRFRIRAQVRWKRASGRRTAPPGLGLTFLASEHAARDQLLAFVEGDDVNHTERDARRLPVHVEAQVEIGGHDVICQTDDIGSGGCFLLVDKLPPIGTRLQLRLKGPGTLFSWLSLHAVVCWHRRGADREGFGVRFIVDAERDRRRVDKLVALLRERVSREVHLQPPRTIPPTPISIKPTSSMLPRK